MAMMLKKNKNRVFREEEDEEENKSQSLHPLFVVDELIAEILFKTPTKTLFRSKCVCKTWNNLISNQSFIKRFIRKSNSLSPLFSGFIYGSYSSDLNFESKSANFFCTTSNSYDHDSDNGLVDGLDMTLSFLPEIDGGSIVILNSNNGLLLCGEKSKKLLSPNRYYVCNPINKQWIVLPEPKHCDYYVGAILHCYDLEEVHAKFMVICFSKKLPKSLEVEVFCSETGNWEEPKVFEYESPSKGFRRMSLLDGVVYWFDGSRDIYVYDMKKATIDSIPRPGSRCGRLGVSDGSLYFAQMTETGIQVWVLVNGVEFGLKHSIEFENFNKVIDELHIDEHQFDPKSRFYTLDFHPLDCRLVLVKFENFNNVALCRLDRKSLELVKVVNDIQLGTTRNVLVCAFPYFLPAWPPCVSGIQNTS